MYIFSPIPIPYAGVIVSQIVEKKIGNVNININKTYLSSGTKPFNVNLNFSDIELSYQNTAKLAIPDIKIEALVYFYTASIPIAPIYLDHLS